MEKPDFWRLLKAKRKDETEDYPKWHTAQFYKAIKKADMNQTDTDQLDEKEIKNLRLKSKLSPSIKNLKEVQEVQKDDIKKEWGLNIEEMLKSDRQFEGTFHKPVIDKENDIIPASAMDRAMDDFMILPTLQEVHTERTVGIIVKAWKTSDDEYKFVGKIKPGDDCDDVWKKIQKGEYDGLSIGGRRIRYSKDCSIPSSIRTTPCVTHKLKLYNVSVCSSPVNPEATVDSVAKAEDEVVLDLTETLIKAESSELKQSVKENLWQMKMSRECLKATTNL
jgi:phage head maturation protease